MGKIEISMVESKSFAGSNPGQNHRHHTSIKNVHNKMGDHTILDKKVPTNTKYGNVKATVKTGATMKNVTVISD